MTKNDLRLLYVEDDDNLRIQYKDFFERRVNTLILATNGQEGFEEFEKNKPDIIITDIKMPVLNGIEMIKKIRKIDSEIPIIVTSAFSDQDYLLEAINEGVTRYIIKPFNRRNLKKLIDETIEYVLLKKQDKQHQQMMLRQAKVIAVGEMLQRISHQWRQPLNIITTSASSLQLDLELENEISREKQMQYMESILVQSQYMSNIIDEFRTFFDDDTSIKKEVNMTKLLIELTQLTTSSFDNNNIKIFMNIEDEVTLTINNSLFLTSLINISNNAVDACVNNNITEDKRYFFITLKKENNTLQISFKDSAGGIKDEIIDKIFDPYFTTKHESIGIGIGLYLTHTIVTKQLNGTIDVKNVEYNYEGKKLKGAEFIITLPIAK